MQPDVWLAARSLFGTMLSVIVVVLLLISLRNTSDLLVTVGEVALESEPANG